MKRPLRIAIWLVGASMGHIAFTLLLMGSLLLLTALLFQSLPDIGKGLQLLLMLVATVIVPLPLSILLYNKVLGKLKQKKWFQDWLS